MLVSQYFWLELFLYDRVILFSIWFILAKFLLSDLDATAHIAAGIQPINVIWRIKQMIPVIIFPLKKNDNQGMKIATNIIIVGF